MDMAHRIFENKLNTVWLHGSYKKLFDNKLNKALVYNQEQLVEIQKCLLPKKRKTSSFMRVFYNKVAS